MTDRYEIRSPSGRLTGHVEKVTDSPSSPDNYEESISALVFGYPFLSAVAGLLGAGLAAILTLVGRVVVAAAAKATGASSAVQERILSTSPFEFSGWVGGIICVVVLSYLTFRWFSNANNRRTFAIAFLLIVVVIGLITAWRALNNYVSTDGTRPVRGGAEAVAPRHRIPPSEEPASSCKNPSSQPVCPTVHVTSPYDGQPLAFGLGILVRWRSEPSGDPYLSCYAATRSGRWVPSSTDSSKNVMAVEDSGTFFPSATGTILVRCINAAGWASDSLRVSVGN